MNITRKESIRKRWLKKGWENNATIAVNVLYAKKEKIYPAFVSVWENNANREKQVIFFIIPSKEKQWHYFAVKELSRLLSKTTSEKNVWFLLFELSSFL